MVSTYCFPTKTNQVFSEKCLSLGQRLGTCKMNVEHLIMPGSKGDSCGHVQRTEGKTLTGSPSLR